MPLALALAGSVLIHLGALFGADFELPGLSGPEPPVVVSVVLAPPAAAQSVPVAAVRPLPRPAPRPVAPVAAAPAPAAAPTVPPASTLEPASANGGQSASPVPDAPSPVAAAADTSAAAGAPPPTALPARGRIRYTITRGEQGFVVGQSTHEWEHDGRAYRARSITETTGLAALFKPARVLQSSEGELRPDGLRPREFRHERVNGLDQARFDWDRGLLAYDGRETGLPAGTQDMLSLYYQASLQAVAGAGLDVPVATGRKLETYRFESRGEETLTVAGRPWRTLHLAARGGGDAIELWIAPELPGLPLKIRFVDRKGEIFDQMAERFGTEAP